ncbi:ABC transporter ATP-binding protein [Arthrobacter bambusae]|uniref:ABC transporter ATP-binding protein n=1 Tax=Arthrobacter bambusae TaxID=1338426 RepID=UPI00277D5885|nr:ABC transporter ATP-binding protein [Arthrobacter bambusae]MDQ0239530.1 oligopeptide/dipeptide ABC transporter ATP-binding protein [Arthrobacter bambusae]
MKDLLRVNNLSIFAPTAAGEVPLVRSLTFNVSGGERVALVGESGSGKSVTARAIMRLDPGLRTQGEVLFDGQELSTIPEEDMAGIRGGGIGMVFQDPMSALNPLMRIGEQIAEPLAARGVPRRTALAKARQVLDELGVADAARRMWAYPHEFSGGMRQRVVIAMALVAEPSLLIADEPTTALDVRAQEQVLALLSEVSRQRGLATLIITHDIGIVAEFAQRVMVMYSGSCVEHGSVAEIFERPTHPYTQALLQAVPRLDGPIERLVSLPGSSPRPGARPVGCPFAPRCSQAVEKCRTENPELLTSGGHGPHEVACHLAHMEVTQNA